MSQSIHEINHQIKQCNFCRLHETRIKAVCGEGVIPSEFMFIAQAPGRTEDKEGKMFIGPSGKVFDILLSHVELKRRDIYISNLVKCFLPKCRKPRHDEIETCYNLYLKKEIDLVKPEIIVTLGYHVTKFIFKIYGLNVPNRIGFKSTFGKLFVAKNKKIIPLRHPATVVHKSTSLEELKTEYQILRILQSACGFIDKCAEFEQYKKGLTQIDFIDLYCHGDWSKCEYYHMNHPKIG